MRDYQTQPCPSALAHSTFLESQSDRKDRDVEVVVPLSCVRLFVTPWTVAHQASLFIINSQSLLKLMSIADLHTNFSRGRSGGLVFLSLSEFSIVYCDPHSQRLQHSQ